MAKLPEYIIELLKRSRNPKETVKEGLEVASENLKFEQPLTKTQLDVIEEQILPYLENDSTSALGWFAITSPEILKSFTKDALHKTELYLKTLKEEPKRLGSFTDVRFAKSVAELAHEYAQEQEHKELKPYPEADASVVVIGKNPYVAPKIVKEGKIYSNWDYEWARKQEQLRASKKGETDRLKLNQSEIRALLHELNHVAHNILGNIFTDRQSLDPNLTAPKTYKSHDDIDYRKYPRSYSDAPEAIQAAQTDTAFGKIKNVRPFVNQTHEAIYRLLSDELFTEDLAFYNSDVVSRGKLLPDYFSSLIYNERRKYPQVGMPISLDDILHKISTQEGILPSDREYLKTIDGYNSLIQDASQSVLDDLQHTVKENIMQKKNMPGKQLHEKEIKDRHTDHLLDTLDLFGKPAVKENKWYIPDFIENMFSEKQPSNLDTQMKALKVG